MITLGSLESALWDVLLVLIERYERLFIQNRRFRFNGGRSTQNLG